MEYEKYLEKIKSFIEKSTLWQRAIFIFLIVVILVVVIILINPAKKLLEMRNSQRRTDVANILNSVYQYALDNEGNLPSSITFKPTMICRTGAQSCDGMVDVSQIVSNKKYLLLSVPVDPTEKNTNSSGYQISKLSNGRISVSAPLAENKAVISRSK